MSDLHVGTALFRAELLSAAVEETHELAPDLVVIAGDLTGEGYRGEFERCRQFLDEVKCPNVVVTMGNHDARNVGYRHFEDLFGARDSATAVKIAEGRAKVVAIDSTKPDSTRARSAASTTSGSTPSCAAGTRDRGSSSSTTTSWPSRARAET